MCMCFFFFSSRRRHTRSDRDWSSDVCSSDLDARRSSRPLGALLVVMAEPIAEKMREGVEQGVFPGGVLLVSYRGQTVHHAAYGAACLVPEPEPATIDTIYDL